MSSTKKDRLPAVSPLASPSAMDASEMGKRKRYPLAVLTRRDVIAAGVGVIVTAAGGAWLVSDPAGRQSELTPEEYVEWSVRGALSYLRLEPEGLRTFASMYLNWLKVQPRPPVDRMADTVERYLKSTDFFPNGADETRLVQFMAFYDPYMSPCNVPFMPKFVDSE